MTVPLALSERFDEAIKAQQDHIRIARVLIARAVELIKKPNMPVDDLIKATASLEKGTRMETRASAELIKLTKEKPR